MQKQCDHSRFLSQLVQDELSDREQTRLESHIETCEVCQQSLDKLVDGDETAQRVGEYLHHGSPITDKVLLDVMKQIRSTTCDTATPPLFRLEDFAVEYLHPAENANSLGRLGGYEISEVIGCGGMGIVLKGHDAKLNRVVAVKVLMPSFALNTTARKRFLREAQAAAAIGHPNVVTIHLVDEDRLPYLVMEYVDGPSLQERLDSEGFLHLHQILRIGVQVASGLCAAHAQGLVHRDIKPGNILLENGMERVKLTDFGLARAADDASVTREGTVVGTPQYMSPEQARGEPVDQTSDLFSLGSVLYALATGRPPFRAESSFGVMRKITDQPPTPIRELNPEIPDWLCALIDRLMAKEKHDRFSNAVEVHQLLESCLSHVQQPTVNRLPEIPDLSIRKSISPVPPFYIGIVTMVTIVFSLLFVFDVPALVAPDKSVNERSAPQAYQKEFVVEFADPQKVGTLNVDIKRGSIEVSGYDGDKVVVELSVPQASLENSGSDGLKTLRPNTLDFEIEPSDEQIKVDGNSYEHITNLKIKVPKATNLILDTYQNGFINVRDVEGGFRIRSYNTDIRLQNVSGAGRLWSYNGNLSADFQSVPSDQSLELETYNGSIDIALPATTKANAKYRSGSGRVSTDFEVDLSSDVIRSKDDGSIKFDPFVRGTINGGGAPLTLETEKGDIRLRRRMSESLR